MRLQINQKWLVLAIIILCVLALPIGLIGKGRENKSSENADSDSTMSDFSAKFKDHLQVIRLSGLIVDREDGLFPSIGGEDSYSVLKKLRKAVKDDRIKGILLHINSPGGTVSASQEIADEILAIKKKNKPVVVSMGDVAASGGYYIACSSDKIVAEPGTLTGSIGVIFNSLNLKGLGDKLGIQSQIVKSGPFKDIGSPYRIMKPEEKAILQELILDSYDQFVEAVAKGRGMSIEAVKKIADGRIYSGRQAQKLGLIDQLGGYDQAIELLQTICQSRYGRKEKYPVCDSSADTLWSAMMESSSSSLKPFLGHSEVNPGQILPLLLPEFMQRPLNNQLLWIRP